MSNHEEARSQIFAVLQDLLNAAFTEEEILRLCSQRFPDGYQSVKAGSNKVDRIVRLIDYCARHAGQLTALVNHVDRARPRQYDHFARRLRPLLPFPDVLIESATPQAKDRDQIQILLALREMQERRPPAGTRVYAWLRVDEDALDIAGAAVQPVTWQESNAEPLIFDLRPRRSGHHTLRIELYHESNYLGTVKKNVEVAAGGPRQPISIEATVTLEPDLAPPDLLIRFYRAGLRGNETRYDYRVISTLSERPLMLAHMGTVTVNDPASVLKPVLEDLDRWARLETPSADDLETRLTAIGSDLYLQLVPDELDSFYWDLPRRCRSVQIISDEPTLPWEMLRPKDRQGRIDEALARQFALTRWHADASAAPAMLRLNRVKICVARPKIPLKGAEPEAVDLEMLLGERATRIEPQSLLAALDNSKFDVLHLISHGYAQGDNADESYLELGAGKPPMRASDLSRYNWLAYRPLLFVNACYLGREGAGLTGVGGWATTALTRAGAGAFIGALWQATDGTAGQFARDFYTQLAAGATVGDAARHARLAIAAHPDPTWLCYTVYAHPNTRVL